MRCNVDRRTWRNCGGAAPAEQARFNAQIGSGSPNSDRTLRGRVAMRRAALLALLAFGLLACAHLAASLPSQSAVLKRKRGKKRASAEQRQLAERDWVAASVQRYLSNQELGEWLTGFEKRCKAVAKLSTIGASAEGRCGHPLPPAAAAATAFASGIVANLAFAWLLVWPTYRCESQQFTAQAPTPLLPARRRSRRLPQCVRSCISRSALIGCAS